MENLDAKPQRKRVSRHDKQSNSCSTEDAISSSTVVTEDLILKSDTEVYNGQTSEAEISTSESVGSNIHNQSQTVGSDIRNSEAFDPSSVDASDVEPSSSVDQQVRLLDSQVSEAEDQDTRGNGTEDKSRIEHDEVSSSGQALVDTSVTKIESLTDESSKPLCNNDEDCVLDSTISTNSDDIIIKGVENDFSNRKSSTHILNSDVKTDVLPNRDLIDQPDSSNSSPSVKIIETQMSEEIIDGNRCSTFNGDTNDINIIIRTSAGKNDIQSIENIEKTTDLVTKNPIIASASDRKKEFHSENLDNEPNKKMVKDDNNNNCTDIVAHESINSMNNVTSKNINVESIKTDILNFEEASTIKSERLSPGKSDVKISITPPSPQPIRNNSDNFLPIISTTEIKDKRETITAVNVQDNLNEIEVKITVTPSTPTKPEDEYEDVFVDAEVDNDNESENYYECKEVDKIIEEESSSKVTQRIADEVKTAFVIDSESQSLKFEQYNNHHSQKAIINDINNNINDNGSSNVIINTLGDFKISSTEQELIQSSTNESIVNPNTQMIKDLEIKGPIQTEKKRLGESKKQKKEKQRKLSSNQPNKETPHELAIIQKDPSVRRKRYSSYPSYNDDCYDDGSYLMYRKRVTPSGAVIFEYIKHPLENKWCLWFFKPDQNRHWAESQKKVCEFETVEDFWSIHNHILPPSELKNGCDYSVFKKDLRPMWEDPRNAKGGRWVVTLGKYMNILEIDFFWQELLLLMVGEAFEQDSVFICGTVINKRPRGDKIALWVGEGNNTDVVLRIGRKIKETLNLPPNFTICFQKHSDANVKGSVRTSYTL